eukprot:scaffold211672_cov15-Tisochrysis_lutea.AAC.1
MLDQHWQSPLQLQRQQHGNDGSQRGNNRPQQEQQPQDERFDGPRSGVSFGGNGSSPPSQPINIPYSQAGHACSEP